MLLASIYTAPEDDSLPRRKRHAHCTGVQDAQVLPVLLACVSELRRRNVVPCCCAAGVSLGGALA